MGILVLMMMCDDQRRCQVSGTIVIIDRPHRNIPSSNNLNTIMLWLPTHPPTNFMWVSWPSMQTSQSGQCNLSLISLTTYIPLSAWHNPQISPSSSELGAAMPGLMRAVASQTISIYMSATVRMRKKVEVSSNLLSLCSSSTVAKLTKAKLKMKMGS